MSVHRTLMALKLPLNSRAFSASPHARVINKIMTATEALERSGLKSGQLVLAGGFGLCGIPRTMLTEIIKTPGIDNLTVVSNNAGTDSYGLGLLAQQDRVGKLIVSYIGENKPIEEKYLRGDLEIELTPQGTIAERIRAAAAGQPACFAAAGVGTLRETGEMIVKYAPDGTAAKYAPAKETRIFNGKKYLVEEPLQGDVSIIKAHKADRLGNVVFRETANNFNGVMARASNYTIVEVDEIVEVGDLDPVFVHVPGIYVNAVIQSTMEKQFERIKNSLSAEELAQQVGEGTGSSRERIIKRAAKEFTPGMYANLGIGMPTLAPNYVAKELDVQLQSENGVIGVGPYPEKGKEDQDCINAGKETVTLLKGASSFGSEESFAMIRAGRINMSMLGAMQCSMYGDIANWVLPGRVKGMGGAMDLVAASEKTKIVVTMEHCDKKGNPKILKSCEFPLTGRRCVSRIITELAVFDVDHVKGMHLIEIAEGVSVDEVKAKTGAPFTVDENIVVF